LQMGSVNSRGGLDGAVEAKQLPGNRGGEYVHNNHGGTLGLPKMEVKHGGPRELPEMIGTRGLEMFRGGVKTEKACFRRECRALNRVGKKVGDRGEPSVSERGGLQIPPKAFLYLRRRRSNRNKGD